jgi:hypothetical protein
LVKEGEYVMPLWGIGEDRSSGTALGVDYRGTVRSSNTGPVFLRNRVNRRVGIPVDKFPAINGADRQRDEDDGTKTSGTPIEFTQGAIGTVGSKGLPWDAADGTTHVEISDGTELESGRGIQATNNRYQAVARENGWHHEYRYIDSNGNSRVRDVHLVATSTNIATSIGLEIVGVDFLEPE